ncbi:MAG: ABC transporter ATP-binding protein [Synergistaceae bacterium]|nr:ABC transporter ATP-binding protein [Synergistaceae bacterium]
MLDIRGLHVVYRTLESDVYAINGLDLSVSEGETLGLVGETGAGKTTTALSILKLLPDRVGFITKGEITLDGVELTKVSEADMQMIRGNTVSMIFQDPMSSLNPVIPVGKQVEEVLTLHRRELSKREIDEQVDSIFGMVGLPPSRKHEYPHQFSGGMKQRIVIAIALSCQPKLLLADEPTTALDVTIQAQVLDMMRDLKEKLRTSMILITHDLGVVAELCDRVAIMYAGEIIEMGSIDDLYGTGDKHPYTEGLFGSLPSLTGDERRLHPIDGLMPDPTSLPQGCKFYERCPKRTGHCEAEAPALNVSGTHSVRCRLFAG